MSITSVKEMFGQKGDFQATPGKPMKRNYSRYFQCVSNRIDEDPITVAFASDAAPYGKLPKLGDTYTKTTGSKDILAKVVGITPEQDKTNPKTWTVEVKYQVLDTDQSTDPGNKNPDNKLDPRNWNLDISGSSERYTEPMYFDHRGCSLINSAGQPYSPPVSVEREIWRHVFSFWNAKLNLNWCYTYGNTLNKKAIWTNLQIPDINVKGVPPTWAKCMPIDYKNQWIDGTCWWQFTVTILVKRGGWLLRPLDRGFEELISTTGDSVTPPDMTLGTKPIYNQHGLRPSQPVNLNGLGHPLNPANGTPYCYVPDGNGVYHYMVSTSVNDASYAEYGYHPMPLRDWFGLGLPDISAM